MTVIYKSKHMAGQLVGRNEARAFVSVISITLTMYPVIYIIKQGKVKSHSSVDPNQRVPYNRYCLFHKHYMAIIIEQASVSLYSLPNEVRLESSLATHHVEALIAPHTSPYAPVNPHSPSLDCCLTPLPWCHYPHPALPVASCSCTQRS